jgi:hypothetical protein
METARAVVWVTDTKDGRKHVHIQKLEADSMWVKMAPALRKIKGRVQSCDCVRDPSGPYPPHGCVRRM